MIDANGCYMKTINYLGFLTTARMVKQNTRTLQYESNYKIVFIILVHQPFLNFFNDLISVNV